MAIITKPGLQLVYDLIRKENPGLPPDLESLTKLVGGEELPDGRFKVRLLGNYGDGFEGARDITYRRLNLASLLGGYRIGVRGPVSLYEAFADIERQYGITLSENDVEDVVAGPLPHAIKLKAKASSATYFGEASVTLVERPPYLDELITVADYDVNLSFVPITEQPMEILTYNGDYTSIAPQLWHAPAPFVKDDILVAGERLDELAAALKSVDAMPWNEVENSPYFLEGARVVYHGKSKMFPAGVALSRGSQEYVLLLELPINSTGVAGSKSLAYFHYNRWVDAAYAAANPGPWEI